MDIFAFNLQSIDLASLAAIPRYTCGDLNHYPGGGEGGGAAQAALQHAVLQSTR